MSETTARLLGVLGALQARPTWTGPQLATHLGVTVRTVRRDIDRLRQLGYAIDSDTGASGGYRLGVGGAAVPPLVLDTDEAFALAMLVRAVASSHSDGTSMGEAAQRAIAKLEYMLPTQLRKQVALTQTLIRVQSTSSIDDVDGATVRTISSACRAQDELQVTYRDRSGRITERRLLPYRLVSIGRRWYLVARDARLPDWRTWRVDRIEHAVATGHRFELSDPPDAVHLVQQSISTAPYRHQARVELQGAVEEIAAIIPPSAAVLEAIDDHTTLLTTGSDDLNALALHIGLIGVPFRVLEPDELSVRILEVADRLQKSAQAFRPQGADPARH